MLKKVMGDGGFEIGEYNKQEFITKQLILCEYLTALNILRKGGFFINYFRKFCL
jgi:cap1 methyltransferase